MSAEPESSTAHRDRGDDEIVEQIPVFVSNQLAQRLSILRFAEHGAANPASSFLRDTHDGPQSPIRIRVKPGHHAVEIAFRHPFPGKLSKSKSSAVQPENGEEANDEEVDAGSDEDINLDDLELSTGSISADSMRAIVRDRTRNLAFYGHQKHEPHNLCVGIVRDGALHLSSVSRCVEMKPCTRVFDKVMEKHAANTAELGGRTESDMEKVQVTIKSESRRRKESMESTSYSRVRDEIAAESWVRLQFQEPQSEDEVVDTLSVPREQLEKPDEILMDMTSEEYLNQFAPRVQEREYNVQESVDAYGRSSSGHLVVDKLQKLPVRMQVKGVLTVLGCVTFARVRQLATNAESDDHLRECLQEISVMINGAYFCVSEEMHSGVVADAHDYILGKLIVDGEVTKRDVSSTFPLALEDSRMLFQKLCKYDSSDSVYRSKYTDEAESSLQSAEEKRSMVEEWTNRIEELREKYEKRTPAEPVKMPYDAYAMEMYAEQGYLRIPADAEQIASLPEDVGKVEEVIRKLGTPISDGVFISTIFSSSRQDPANVAALREAIARIVYELQTFTRKVLAERLETEGFKVKDSIVLRFLKSFATSRGAMWTCRLAEQSL